MQITRTSLLTGQQHTCDIPVTEEELSAWRNGEPAQVVMPNLSADQRKFIMTGITKEEWDEIFGDEE